LPGDVVDPIQIPIAGGRIFVLVESGEVLHHNHARIQDLGSESIPLLNLRYGYIIAVIFG